MTVEIFIAHLMGIVAGIVLTLLVQSAERSAQASAKRRYEVERPYLGHVPPKPIPQSADAMWRQWVAFSVTTQRAYGSFERYVNHLDADPSRSLENPVPQPMPMHIEPTKPWPKW